MLAELALAGLLAWGWYQTHVGPVPEWARVTLALLMAVTVYATSMIYASLRTVARWHHPLTPVCYLLFAAAGGLLAVLLMMAALGQAYGDALELSVLLALGSALGIKIVWWQIAGAAGSGSSLATATGLSGLGTVRIMPPHTSENYLQHEMGFVVARKHAARLRNSVSRWGCGTGGAVAIYRGSAPVGLAVLLHLAGCLLSAGCFLLKQNMWSASTMVIRINQKWHWMRHYNIKKIAAQW